jgi:hypothetical protein
LDRGEGIGVIGVNLSVEVVVGYGGYGGSSEGVVGLRRHVWGVGMKVAFLKIKRIRAVFISEK